MNIPKINLEAVKGAAKSTAKNIGNFASKNAPALAGGAAIACTIGAIWATVKATKKYEEEIMTAEIRKNSEHISASSDGEETETEFQPLTKKEKLLIAAKCYWLVVLLAVLSGTATVASVKFSNKQIQALAILASGAESALNRTEGAVEDIFGKGKLEKVRLEANNKEVSELPPPSEDSLIERSSLGGSTLIRDTMCKRYFYGDISKIEHAVNQVNAELLRDIGYVSINEFYNALGISGVEWGEYLGWSFDEMGTRLIDVKLEYATDPHERPIVVMKVKTQPKHDWRDC